MLIFTRKSILSLFIVMLSFGLFAQKKEVFNRNFITSEYASFCLGYYGNSITRPGAKAGFDWDFFMIEKTIEKKKKTKVIRKKLLLSPSVTLYTHPDSHMGLIISADVIWRRYLKRLYILDVGVGAGYYTKFNSGETWEVDENGDAQNIGSTSTGYFSPVLTFSFGKQFILKNNTPMDVYTRLNVNALVSYNAGTSAEYSLELGVRMPFNWGIKRGSVKIITKNK